MNGIREETDENTMKNRILIHGVRARLTNPLSIQHCKSNSSLVKYPHFTLLYLTFSINMSI